MSSKLNPLSSESLPRYTGLEGSSDACALARLANRNPAGQLLAVITASALDAQRLLEEIPFFAPDLRVSLLPDWETLPYDIFSPHQDLISERLATFYQIAHNACDVLIIPVTTALYRMPPREFLAAHSFFVNQGSTLDLQSFRSQMSLAGYSHVSQVLSPGEYSIRGGLIDLFPMGSPLPYRIDLFDDEIESIRSAVSIRSRRSGCCRRGNFHSTITGAADSAPDSGKNSRAIPHAAGFTRKSARAIFPPESNIICRFFSNRRPRCSITWRSIPQCVCTGRSHQPSKISGRIPVHAIS